MIKQSIFIILLFFIFIGSAECKKPVPHTKNNYFYPVADTYVYEKSNTVSVKELELRVGNQNTNKLGNIKSALRFDISEIPGNSIINEAHLSVYSFNAEPSWGARPIQAYPAQQTWSETSIDWIQINDINVQTFDSTFIAGIPGSSPDTYSWDITNIVQSWVNGEINCGVVLQSNAKIFNNYIIICSSNNLLFKPFLNISYTLSESTSLDLKLPGKTNSSKLNDPMDVENIAKTDKINETISESSVIAADHIPLNDTSPDMIQTAAKAILPEITKHPQSQVKNPGLPVNFLVTVSGTPPLFFQWQKDGMDIEGENSKSVTIDSVALNDKGFYSCNVSNDAGSVKSNDAELLLNLPVRIIKHPLSQSITNKKPVTFTVTAEGKAPWSYQWKKNHINILGATSKNFTIESVKKKDEGVYACEVSNDFSNDISDDARLIVIHPPKITHQPQSQVKNPGTPAIFNVTVSAPLLSFQWLKDGVTIDGATSETFTIDAVSKKDAGAYTCNVFNDAGSVVSNGAELFVNKMAAILKQPISQSIVYEKPVTFSLTTAGKPPLSYQWKKDHINIPGAISNSYTIKSVQKKDEGIYTCEVSNNFSNDISHDAMLVIFYPPEITSHPSSQTNDPDTSATFSVTASGTPPFSYQWMKDKTVISNAVADSYTIDSVSEKDEGTFTCTITNAAGTQTSEPAILSVNDPVQITKQPFPQSKKSGEPVTFSVTAVGTLPLSFQWEKDSLDILGATEKSYTIDSVQKSDVGLYTCEIHNGFSNDISNDIILVVKNPPEILLHPLSQIKNPKMPVTFSITASGTPPFAFQWMKDGIAIDKAVTDSFIIDSVSKADEGTFTCTVTNDAGNMISNPAVLSVNDPVQITQHPQSQLQKTGMPVTFSVTASGSLPLLFQWQRDGVNIDGATSQNFTIDSISKNDEGYFSCKVSNDA
ncbi:MAG: immunoglobulin domain-containing protein, partial [Desulfobacteraceae bacterium]|nr:immunoglobulin domain-containing protein [Desulfobacteraceae bacterium]